MRSFRAFFLAPLLAVFAIVAHAEDALQEITINAGDTMWGISNKYLKDPQKWPEIVKYNKLPTADPTMALPGTKIKLPVMLIKDEYRKAQLVRMTAEVRYKRKNESDWSPAEPLMTLGYEDSVRTMKGADARVRFPTREEIQINENSLVVLKPEKIVQEVQIFQGEIRASRAKVIMPNGAVVKPRVASDYQAKVREDKTQVVFVYKGEVDVTAQGKTVRVPEGYGTTVPEKAAPSEPQPLPSFPDFNPAELLTRAPGTTMSAPKPAGTPRPVENAPSGPPKAKSVVSENLMVNYKIQMAKDPKFSTILLERTEKIGQPFDIKKQSIPDGTYIVRLAFIDAFGVQSAWSAPTQAIRDTSPPQITNLTPKDNQRIVGEDAYCDVVGDVKDAAMVAINGELVFITPAGHFTKFVNLTPGINKISVLARDTRDNEVIVERKVEYVPTPQAGAR